MELVVHVQLCVLWSNFTCPKFTASPKLKTTLCHWIIMTWLHNGKMKRKNQKININIIVQLQCSPKLWRSLDTVYYKTTSNWAGNHNYFSNIAGVGEKTISREITQRPTYLIIYAKENAWLIFPVLPKVGLTLEQ